MPRLSRIRGEARPTPVTMSLKACVVVSPIARPRKAATSIKFPNLSASFPSPSIIARLDAKIISDCATVPWLAAVIDASIFSDEPLPASPSSLNADSRRCSPAPICAKSNAFLAAKPAATNAPANAPAVFTSSPMPLFAP